MRSMQGSKIKTVIVGYPKGGDNINLPNRAFSYLSIPEKFS